MTETTQPQITKHFGAYEMGPADSPNIQWRSSNKLKVKLFHEDAQAPTRGHATDAGLDLYSCEDVLLEPFGSAQFDEEKGAYVDTFRATVSTGIAVAVEPGFGMFIWDRSGMSAKHGQHRVAGVVDSQYRGEVKVALVNLTPDDYLIKKGDRIAQAVISPILLPEVEVVDDLDETARGAGGFGSTGA